MAMVLANAETGTPSLKIRRVPLYMDNPRERLGVAFVNISQKGRITVSPGLAALLNNSTNKATVKRTIYKTVPKRDLEGIRFGQLQVKNKTVLLFQRTNMSPYTQANKFLQLMGNTKTNKPCVISIDALAVEYDRGEVADLTGCLLTSGQHEVIIYENRGEDLSFLLPPRNTLGKAITPQVDTEPASKCGSQKLQEAVDKTKQKGKEKPKHQQNPQGAIGSLCRKIASVTHSVPDRMRNLLQDDTQAEALKRFLNNQKEETQANKNRTRADMGQVTAPELTSSGDPREKWINAFEEFLGVLRPIAVCPSGMSHSDPEVSVSSSTGPAAVCPSGMSQQDPENVTKTTPSWGRFGLGLNRFSHHPARLARRPNPESATESIPDLCLK
ncbi:unnamed protein product [Diatraea saccharalis]|uniref:Uncharacterized protein n=1 Tax=Diatraea saccharalis TaxID=40085 RepID=A0A9N9RAZ7_9NEOP|nr:unnamed protein product [Diatraea saccharalis]